MTGSADLSRLCTITVTYGPDLGLLEAQLAGLPSACRKLVLDNASDPAIFARMQEMLAGRQVELRRNPLNVGLAQAQNQGVAIARDLVGDQGLVLFLDQDTEPDPDGVARLVEAYRDCERRFGAGAAGPRMVDAATGMDHGFHVMQGWRWRRVHPDSDDAVVVDCANLNASGTLVPIRCWLACGQADGSLFIDHVDTDWAFRMRAAGLRLYGIPSVAFVHRMGESSQRLWLLGWRVWPRRSPRRHYYLFRNSVRLLRRSYVPAVWKVWAVAKLAITVAVTMLVDSRRIEQLRQMGRGLRDGLPSGDAISADRC